MLQKRGIFMTQKQLFSQDSDVDQTLLADVLVNKDNLAEARRTK